MKTSQITFCEYIPKAKERTYYECAFAVPENVCRIDVEYSYQRYDVIPQEDGATLRREVSIVDIALRDGRGEYVGASGAGRGHIHVSAWDSSAGYAKVDTTAGEWAIIVGAYKIPDAGVTVTYTITFTHKERTLLLGDTHIHTTASDGKLPLAEAAQAAKRNGLDFLFVTDHNDYAQNLQIPGLVAEGLIVLPGMEWTHFNGHAGLLGVPRPIRSPFCVNTPERVYEILTEARENGAITVLNHPFCPNSGWRFGMDEGQFDLVELVNGGTVPSANEECLRWWHDRLCRGEKCPVIGGSDYHSAKYGKNIGQPATAVYAMSRSTADILDALRRGNGYILLWPKGPALWAEAGGAILGETVPRGTEVHVELTGLQSEDILRIITDKAEEEILCPPDGWQLTLDRTFTEAAFVRFEVIRYETRILISNPIYFE